MRSVAAAACLAALLLAPAPARALDLLTLDGGVGTVNLYDRETESTRNLAAIFLNPSWETPAWDLALDLTLRWDLDAGEFDQGSWNREGDFLRPLRRAAWHPPGSPWSAELGTLDTLPSPGGMVVGGMTGFAEVDYAVPGLVLGWGKEDAGASLFADRVVDTTLAGGRAWLRKGRFLLDLEGAVDPEAPTETFSGVFSGGRPVEDAPDQLWGAGGELTLELGGGEGWELFLLAEAAALSGDAAAAGGGVGVRLDFSRLYTHRLEVALLSVEGVNGFLPDLFDVAYAMERWGLPGQAPLAERLGEGGAEGRIDRVSVRYALGELLRAEADWHRQQGSELEGFRLAVRLAEEGNRGVTAVIWSRVQDQGERLFENERLHARVFALYPVYSHILLRLSYNYGWFFREGTDHLVGGSSWAAGVLYSLTI